MRNPYDNLIMDHIRNARNYRALDDANRTISGSNQLCGDELTLYLRLESDRIEDIAFQSMSCGISMASASIMTEHVKGKRMGEMIESIRTFIALLNGRPVSPSATDVRLQAILESVRNSQSRIGCAALPWTTLESALQCHQPHSGSAAA